MSIPPFLEKTYEIFSDPAHEGVCGWGANNDSVVIHDIDVFAEKVLPKYFKHCKYSSFTRQLHKYDFHKTTNDPLLGEFKHQYFVKDQPEMMVFIQRKQYVNKKYVSGAESLPAGHLGSCFVQSSNPHCQQQENLESIDYNEIESSVERGMLFEDDEALSVLEKRQAHMITESADMKAMIQQTVQENNQMMQTMDMILNSAIFKADLNHEEQPQATERERSTGSPTFNNIRDKVFQPMKRFMKTFKKKN